MVHKDNVFQPFWSVLGHSIYPKYLPRRNGNTCPQNDKNVKNSFIHNIQTLKTTPMSINRRLAIQTVYIHSHNAIPLGDKKEQATHRNNMDESQTLS